MIHVNLGGGCVLSATIPIPLLPVVHSLLHDCKGNSGRYGREEKEGEKKICGAGS